MCSGGIIPARPLTDRGKGEIVTITDWAPIPVGVTTVSGQILLVIGQVDLLGHGLEGIGFIGLNYLPLIAGNSKRFSTRQVQP
jgi:hypothetical protein